MADFELNKLSIIATIGGTPIDISGGLITTGENQDPINFLSVKKESEKSSISTTRRGKNQESYTVDYSDDISRLIELTYLPNTQAVNILHSALKSKQMFGINISYKTEDSNYALTASKCVFASMPDLTASSAEGFGNITFQIRALDAIVVYQ